MARKPDFIAQFKAARRSAAPLIAVRSYDHTAVTRRIVSIFGAKLQEDLPIFTWNCASGIEGLNKKSKAIATQSVTADPMTGMPDKLTGPLSMLGFCRDKLPEDGLVFMQNLNRFWHTADVRQAVWNLRDVLKAMGSTLVIEIGPGVALPEGLTDDVLVLDEPLPTEDELGALVDARAKANDIKLRPEVRAKAVDALIGLAMFPAEQSTEMCFTEDSLDTDLLWERKRQLVEQTKGLTVYRGTEKFVDLGGGENLKAYGLAYIRAEESRPRAILFLDEVEKMFAGAGTESTGIKSGFLQKFLTWMQDNEVDGIMLIGHPGCMKSAFAKALGNEAQCPTIMFDVNGMQQKEVGSSEENLSRGLGIADAIARGRILVIATCNSMGTMPPEFKRRFTQGTFFCDLPIDSAREKIWAIYEKKYGVGGERPDDTGWTGAEIRECCRKAHRLGMSLKQSAEYIVPVSRSAADKVRQLREEATGRYLDSERPGTYNWDPQEVAREGRKVRKIDADVMAARGRA